MRKGVVLVVVLGVMLVISILSVVALNLMTAESRIAEHKIRRIRGFFAAQSAMVHALERLRRSGTNATIVSDINNDDPNIAGIPTNINIIARGANPTDPCPSTSPSDFCVNTTATY